MERMIEQVNYQVVTTNPFISTFLERYQFSNNHIFCQSTKNTRLSRQKCRDKNNKIQLIIMDIIQSYYTLSNKNNGAELIFCLMLV